MKPGYLTTEFWLTLLAQVLPVLALTGVLTAGEVDTLYAAVVEAAKVVAALVVALVPLWRYIDGRAKIKAGG